jgi:MFS family permease
MRKYFSATNMVLFLLCLMYLITYVDRVNISTAGAAIKSDLNRNNTQLGFAFSVFAYPYAVFQIIGGRIGDRFGARATLFVSGFIWAVGTILTGIAGGFLSLCIYRVLLGFGEGATFPTAMRATQFWTKTTNRGFAQGITHSFARFGNAVTPPICCGIDGLVHLARRVLRAWPDQPCLGVGMALVLPRRPEGSPGDHPGRTWLALRMWPVTLTYFCYGWALWLSQLDSVILPQQLPAGS